MAARYGGEEFALILPVTGADEARRIAEALREKVSHLPIPVGAEETHVTISLGVATADKLTAWTPSALLTHADLALYRAKQRGRNRVEVVETASETEIHDALRYLRTT